MIETDTEVKTIILGRVLDEKGRPIGGVSVTCDEKHSRTLFDGSYKFTDIAPGLCVVEVALDGYESERKRIEALEGGENVVNFNLEPVVGDAKIYGYVLDEVTGEPLKDGGSMYMFRPASNRNTLINPETGYFEFAHLSPGRYTIWTAVLDYVDMKKTVVVNEGEDRREDFLIRKEELEYPVG